MESENCVAFRVDKVGSQEPALDLYCSKNNLIRVNNIPHICLLRPPWIDQTKQSCLLPSRGSFLPSCGCDDGCRQEYAGRCIPLWWWCLWQRWNCSIDGDWWHVESIYGWARGVESILSASHEESRDSQPAAITLILSGPRKLSRDRITTSQPTFNTNPKWRTFWTMAKRGKSIQKYSRDIYKLHSFLTYFSCLILCHSVLGNRL